VPAPTLIVIDVQRAFDDPSWGPRNNPQAEARVADALTAWRAAGAPVIHVRHSSSGLFDPDSETFAFKDEAVPEEDEPVVTKHVNSAFIGTDLEARLRQSGVEAVALVGLTTDHCCSTTARMAGNLGFETWVLGDAMATFDRTAPDGEVLPAAVMHQASLASLDGEFAEVLDTRAAVARLDSARARRS
jgi:nicotinamidase-related amidase